MYIPREERYQDMIYRRCGHSGLKLPAISLGLWHNFGAITPFEQQRAVLCAAFDAGITHFDLANNYGPPYGEAERNFGEHMKRDFKPYRDGDHGSRKYLMASLDQSLKRMNLEYVDIFYHHRPDPETPIEETMLALHDIVKSGKALYVGISNYSAEQAQAAIETLGAMGTHMLIHQPNYSMMNRRPEQGLTDVLREKGVGMIAFGPLAGGLLTGKYNAGIPSDSRAAKDPRFLKPGDITPEKLNTVARLKDIAQARGQSLPQLALSWTLRDPVVTSALIGASKPEQIRENVQALEKLSFTPEELSAIDAALNA